MLAILRLKSIMCKLLISLKLYKSLILLLLLKSLVLINGENVVVLRENRDGNVEDVGIRLSVLKQK